MNNEVFINLKGSATSRKYKENELFQKEKFKEITHILERTGGGRKDYYVKF